MPWLDIVEVSFTALFRQFGFYKLRIVGSDGVAGRLHVLSQEGENAASNVDIAQSLNPRL